MSIVTETVSRRAARALVSAAHTRSQYIENSDTAATRELWDKAIRAMDDYYTVTADLKVGERARIAGNLYHLHRAAAAGDTETAAAEYDRAEAAGVLD